MFEVKQTVHINLSDLFEDSIIFGLSLQNTDFKFLNCNYSFRRGNKGHEEECIIATTYTNSPDAKSIRYNFDYELQVLSFLTLLPLTSFVKNYNVKEVESTKDVQIKRSIKKIQQLETVSDVIKRQRATRDLFVNVIQIFNAALRFYYMGEQFLEESFLGFFRTVEQIVSWSFDREEHAGALPIIKQRKKLFPVIEDEMRAWFRSYIGIEYNTEHYQDIISELVDNINNSTRDIFSKINRFCFLHNMQFTATNIQKLIKMRNSIVHGSINIENRNELNQLLFDMFMLSRDVISYQFFHKSFSELMKYQIGYADFY